MSEPDEPEPPADPPKSTPRPTAADSAKLASADVPEGSDTARAFISYASADSSIANAVCSALERQGVKCWIAPRDVTPGELYAGNIVHAIDTTRVVVLVLSQHAADSAHVLREVERASSKRHPIVSFRIDQTPLPDDFAYFLNTSQWLDASATGIDRALPRLVDAVRSVLAKATVGTRVEQSPPVQVKARRRPSHILVPLAIVIVAALSYFVADNFSLSKRDDPQKALVEATSASPADSAGALTIPARSIAVLPFADMSAEKDQEYMSDGIAEEILNLLAQVPDLKVIARTSSFAFKGQNIEVSEIAKKLKVAHVVEGSIRTSGNKLRITAQLVRTADSAHLWSERYDRPLDDIFIVQDEIAAAIVQALQIKFMGGALTRREGGTQDLDAYRLYLQCIDGLNKATEASLKEAENYAELAIKRDPNYGGAWDALASSISVQTQYGFLPASEGFERARKIWEHAVALSPNLADAIVGLGDIHHMYDWNWPAAEAKYQRALKIDPTNYWARNGSGRLYSSLGRWNDAERHLTAARERDPLGPYVLFNLAHLYYLSGRLEESESSFRKLLELEPGFPWTHAYLAKTLLLRDKPQDALPIVQHEIDEAARLSYLAIVLLALDRQSEAEAALNSLITSWADTAAFFVAKVYAYQGDHDLALEWLERAYRQKDASLIDIVGEPLFKNLATDSRYEAFLRKMNLPET